MRVFTTILFICISFIANSQHIKLYDNEDVKSAANATGSNAFFDVNGNPKVFRTEKSDYRYGDNIFIDRHNDRLVVIDSVNSLTATEILDIDYFMRDVPAGTPLVHFRGSVNDSSMIGENSNYALFIGSPALIITNTTTATFTIGGSFDIDSVKYNSNSGTDLTGSNIVSRTIELTGISNNDTIWNFRVYSADTLGAVYPVVSNKKYLHDVLAGTRADINGSDWSWVIQDSYHYSEVNGCNILNDYDGSTNYFSKYNDNINNDILHPTGNWTIHILFYPNSYDGAVKPLYYKNLLATFRIDITGSNRRPILSNPSLVANTTSTIDTASINLLSVVGRSNGANTTYQFFINGDSVLTTTLDNTLVTETTVNNIIIGGNSTTPSSWWNGNIISVAEFEGAQYEPKIQEYYNSGYIIDARDHSESANLVGYWIDHGNDILMDLSGNQNHLTKNGTSTDNIIPAINDTLDVLGQYLYKSMDGFKGSCKLQPNPTGIQGLIDVGIPQDTTWTFEDAWNLFGNVAFSYKDGQTVKDIIVFDDTLTGTALSQVEDFCKIQTHEPRTDV